MIRFSSLVALSLLAAAFAGCGGSDAAPTDVSQLPALSEADRAEMARRDVGVADEEKATLSLTPDVKDSKRGAKKKRVDSGSAEAERF